jgi:hypothetical protein
MCELFGSGAHLYAFFFLPPTNLMKSVPVSTWPAQPTPNSSRTNSSHNNTTDTTIKRRHTQHRRTLHHRHRNTAVVVSLAVRLSIFKAQVVVALAVVLVVLVVLVVMVRQAQHLITGESRACRAANTQ